MKQLILLAEIVAQFTPDGWVAQAAERLCFDLAHTFARHAHFAAHFFESVSLSIEQVVAQLQDADFARRQTIQHFVEVFAQEIVGGASSGGDISRYQCRKIIAVLSS